ILAGDRLDLAFAHPLVRSAALDSIPAGERAALHRHAAGLLAGRDAEPADVARQLAATGPVGETWAADALAAAASEALRHGEPAAAAAWLRRALAEPVTSARRAELLHQ